MRTSQYLNRMPAVARLPLLKMRNLQPRTGVNLSSRLGTAKQMMPGLTEPLGFAPGLLRLEEELGTCHATVIGFSRAFGASEADAAREVERFEDLKAMMPREIFEPELDLRAFFEYLTPFLIFAEPTQGHTTRGANFPKAFEAFESNMNGGLAEVGNCIMLAAIFALYAMASGQPVGEAKNQTSEHSLTYVETQESASLYECQRPDFDIYSNRHPSKYFGEKKNWQELFVGSDDTAYYFRTNLEPEALRQMVPENKWEVALRVRDFFLRAHALKPFRSETSMMRSSSFTFISSLLALRLEDAFYYGLPEELPADQLDLLGCRLQIIEAINPFSFSLYSNWAKYLRLAGAEVDQVRPYTRQNVQLYNLPTDNAGLPVVKELAA